MYHGNRTTGKTPIKDKKKTHKNKWYDQFHVYNNRNRREKKKTIKTRLTLSQFLHKVEKIKKKRKEE